MSLLEITNLTHTYGDKVLYRNAELRLLKGEHMGVTGPNGVGKSTLIKLLTGELTPDGGDIRWRRGIHIGHLSQYAEVDGSYTVHAFLKTAFQKLYRMEEQMEELYRQGAEPGGEEALLKAAELLQTLDALGFYQLDSDIAKMEQGLGLTALGLDTPLDSLSGGQRAKVILAKLLLERADVLLLDEPTNFLDKEHVAWLGSYLAGFPGAFLVVSHDSAFLEAVTTCVCDIEFGAIRKYHGKYSEFLHQKEFLREDYIRQYHAQQKEIEKTEAYIRKNKAGVNAKMARGRQKQLDRLERIAPPTFTVKPDLTFTELPLTSQDALVVKGLSVGYSYPLLPQLNLVVPPGQKLVVTGFNGIGKSTLLKTLVGELPPLEGSCRFADAVRLSYYEQELSWEDGAMTPISIISTAYPQLSEKLIRKHLAKCGVKNDSARQAVGTLSGGEQSKVKLCRLLLSPTNFLILDEPTNHLDADTKEALGEALRRFRGSVLLVSHEERFYRDFADKIFQMDRYVK